MYECIREHSEVDEIMFEKLQNTEIKLLSEVLSVSQEEITNVAKVQKGMSNRSFEFECRGQKYIFRIPGEGTEKFVKRIQELHVYQTIADKGFCDNPIYINPEKGYKLTAFLDDVRVCDDDNVEELTKCMMLLKKLHNMKLKVDHVFDIFKEIQIYEELWGGKASCYADYSETKKHVLSLKPFIERYAKPMTLTHIDANCDNFLFYKKKDGTEGLQLMDWEYAGMQDPDVDIAVFGIYSMYDREKIDRLIDIYYEGKCDENTRTKIYCYIAACGLLWSNWCEYKSLLGVEFGEYSSRQYQYAKEYYEVVQERILSQDS